MGSYRTVCKEGGLASLTQTGTLLREDRKAGYWPDRWLFQLTGMLADFCYRGGDVSSVLLGAEEKVLGQPDRFVGTNAFGHRTGEA